MFFIVQPNTRHYASNTIKTKSNSTMRPKCRKLTVGRITRTLQQNIVVVLTIYTKEKTRC